MNLQRIDQLDVFYISFDEPQCERFWAELRAQVPWAKRIHGVKGFDNAHRACGEMSKTERLITVDGDNLVHSSFFDMSLELSPDEVHSSFSWGAENAINGLSYGNGGLKCWNRETILRMNSHSSGQVDFCWDQSYVSLKNVYSTTYTNGSPYQAFRAGFREGIKLLLDRGRIVPVSEWKNLWFGNLKRLEMWCSVGLDVHNGGWSILGARQGVMELARGINPTLISDYDWFSQYWIEIQQKYAQVETRILEMEPILREIGLNVCLFTPEQSRFYKQHSSSPIRSMRVMERE